MHPTNGNHPDRAETERARAFKTDVEPELEVLFRVARTLTGSSADAEDLVQETLIRAFRALDRFDGQYPRSWLLTILRNTNINMARRRRPDVAEDVGSLRGGRPAFGATRELSPEESVLAKILTEDLETALNSLPKRFRTVLLLVDVDRLTYAEAAEALGTPIGTIMSRLSRPGPGYETSCAAAPPHLGGHHDHVAAQDGDLPLVGTPDRPLSRSGPLGAPGP